LTPGGIGVIALGVAVLAALVVIAVGLPKLKDPAVARAGQAIGYTPPKPTKAPPVAVFLGDSYTAGAGASTPAKRWTTLAAARLGWTEINAGFGGTGYTTAGPLPGGSTYGQRVRQVIADHPSIVIVSGGGNDLSVNGQTEQAMQTAASGVFAALRRGLPHATIAVTLPIYIGAHPTPQFPVAITAVRRAAQSAHLTVLDLGEPLAGLPRDIGPDHEHPNDAGYAVIAADFEKAWTTSRSR
jgi:lysophospholipase L1-like esterase